MRIPSETSGIIEIWGATLIFASPNIPLVFGYLLSLTRYVLFYDMVMIFLLLGVITHQKYAERPQKE